MTENRKQTRQSRVKGEAMSLIRRIGEMLEKLDEFSFLGLGLLMAVVMVTAWFVGFWLFA
ncbi:TPA: hypothetical protein DDY56_01390 [Candidatus Uhrbacteria bacterium]|nr:MAG: hypothetical protein A2317_02595 [Candidatus Uhrbacteria bacterium RIFOXYB2_FULL_41_10]HAL50344.1 hypothetical protein [Candidatus Uhrbacteria bacterium]HAN06827.1 hypothetical protein [Candidatus Uhrbacteria bacterium]HAP65494.1 hypothetical protein [Candidatus Uhrbacteria bacterium]HBA52119.1 hypothetical protein [Candidatus Uhrbacteria bacterium]